MEKLTDAYIKDDKFAAGGELLTLANFGKIHFGKIHLGKTHFGKYSLEKLADTYIKDDKFAAGGDSLTLADICLLATYSTLKV